MTDQTPDNMPWYQSRIIWTQILTFATVLLGGVGYQLTPADQQQLVEVIISIITAATSVITIYHRLAKPCPPITTKGEPK